MAKRWPNWVIDASQDLEGAYCFVPIEDDGSLVVGMNFISRKCPGKLAGVVHEGGQDAVEKWCEKHPEWKECADAEGG